MNIESLLTKIEFHQPKVNVQALERLVLEHLKWNKTFNISAFRDEHSVKIYQIIDSLSVYPFIDTGRLLDIGTGPGFPGLPLAICFPDLHITLLDSSSKKLAFARHIQALLELKNVDVVHARIEKYEPDLLFDQIISRAFTDLSGMLSVSLPLLADNGQILAMKGQRIETEVTESLKTHQQCSIEVHQVPHIVDEHRVVAVIKRIKA